MARILASRSPNYAEARHSSESFARLGVARLPLFGNFSYSAIFCAILTNFKLNKLPLEAGKGRNPSRRPPIRRREEYNGNTVQLTRMRTGGDNDEQHSGGHSPDRAASN